MHGHSTATHRDNEQDAENEEHEAVHVVNLWTRAAERVWSQQLDASQGHCRGDAPLADRLPVNM